MMKSLLTTMAVLEVLAGVGLLAAPTLVADLLLGASLDTAAQLLARVAGGALLSLGVACWFARADSAGPAGRAVACAMLVYNGTTTAVLAYGGAGLGLGGALLWPAALLHAGLAAWCASIVIPRARPSA